MKKNENGKWRWIAEECFSLGYYSSNVTAEFLASTQERMYGNWNVPAWEKFLEDTWWKWKQYPDKTALIKAVSEFKPFDVCCAVNKEECKECRYGRTYGKCAEAGSLTQLWVKTFSMDSKGKPDENECLEIKNKLVWMYGPW